MTEPTTKQDFAVEMAEEDRDLSWSLGDDSDCDVCGGSWNEAEFMPDFHDDNKWEFRYGVGCYGGKSVSYDTEKREQELNEIFEQLSDFPEWKKEYEATVRNMIMECER
jgi:hypothetical protein